MTKEELLDLPRKKLDKWNLHSDLIRFQNYFMPVDIYAQSFHENEYEDVEIFGIFEKICDHRRGGWVNLITFRGQNLFITVRAGREGDDHYDIFFFDKELLSDFFKYMRSFLVDEFENMPMFADETMPRVTNFYGYDLDKELLDLDLPLKYKEGDIVNVLFPEFRGYENMNLRARIVGADPKTTTNTYVIELFDFVLGYETYALSMRDQNIVPKYDVTREPPNYDETDTKRVELIKKILKDKREFVKYNLSYDEEDKMLSPL